MIFISSVLVLASALAVEEAWKEYQANPKKAVNPSWVTPIASFETFKRQWDEAKAYNGKYATVEDAWVGYKVKKSAVKV